MTDYADVLLYARQRKMTPFRQLPKEFTNLLLRLKSMSDPSAKEKFRTAFEKFKGRTFQEDAVITGVIADVISQTRESARKKAGESRP
jgi:hypothetical protein